MDGELRLYNTLTRTKEVFTPLDPKNVRMYVCGPTVYDFAHIGNARPVIVFDVLFRLLRHLYGADHVTYARNITDIDDKINARALERWTKKRPLTQEIRDLTDGTLAQFHRDVDALGALRPTHEPRATDFVASGTQPTDMVRIIEKLVARGHAYAAEGHVLFDVPSMSKYGRLSRFSKKDMRAGARVEVAPYKRDPMDFVLWKPSNPETEPGWNSRWGFGRPGWHIECSAMSGALLGETFDIHGGGLDLIFPHHENEIAQTCCAFGIERMASVWMHNGFLRVEGEKMSKSLGNFVTIHELLETDTFGGRKWPGDVLRLAMLKTHYRQPIDWTVRALEEAEKALERFANATAWAKGMDEDRVQMSPPLPENKPSDEVLSALSDDLNFPGALAALHEHYRKIDQGHSNREKQDAMIRLWADLNFLGFDIDTFNERLATSKFIDQMTSARVETRVSARLAARREKNWAESDRIRDELSAMGIQLKDGKDPVTGEPTTTWEVKR